VRRRSLKVHHTLVLHNARHERSLCRHGRRYSREQITMADLEIRVHRFYGGFDTVHVRTYVAILVERLVRHSIDEP